MEADDYSVEEGFGDYYLELRNREAERREQERAQRASEQERLRRETPLLDQLHQAIERKDGDRCSEVLKDALDRDDKGSFDEGVSRLFARELDAKFLAGALRPVLNALTLAPDQWVDVAEGGALLGNHAIRDIAVSRANGFSADRLRRLELTLSSVPPADRSALEQLVQKLRAKPTSSAPSDAGAGSWLSRFFEKRPPTG